MTELAITLRVYLLDERLADLRSKILNASYYKIELQHGEENGLREIRISWVTITIEERVQKE